MNIPKEFISNQVQHRHAGNGWIVVEWCSDEWARIAPAFFKETNQMFLVWTNLLSLENIRNNNGTPANPVWIDTGKVAEIHHSIMDKVKEIRKMLASGEWSIQDTRLVKSAQQ